MLTRTARSAAAIGGDALCGDAAIARRSAALVSGSEADHAPRAQSTRPWRLLLCFHFPPRFTTSPAEAIACTCSFVASAAADR